MRVGVAVAVAGFPAHAGIDLTGTRRARGRRRFPRTRGDRPHTRYTPSPSASVSPHTRGSTLCRLLHFHSGSGFPAHAGIDPKTEIERIKKNGFPRTRGDRPALTSPRCCPPAVSPHTRGSTALARHLREAARGFPAHAGIDPRHAARLRVGARFPRTRGDRPYVVLIRHVYRTVSPHTRGSTLIAEDGEEIEWGFPAHAGIDLL